jgi:dimethylglycine catabolism A
VTPVERLLSPFELGALRLRNRVFISAHTTNFGERNRPTARHARYHRERAEGGVGLIITEGIRVHPTSAAREAALGAFTADCVADYARIPEAVHAAGGAVVAQLLHLGRQAAGDHARTASWGPSPDPWKTGGHVPHAMTRADIDAVVDAFRRAAGWMLEAGFDGVEVHLGHGHLLQQFLSPAVNRRTDAYGGSEDGRLRLSREVLTAVLEVADGRAPVGIRISADEMLPGGLEPEQMVHLVGRLLDDHPLAFVHVSHSAYVGAYTLATQMADMSFPPAAFRSYPARFKHAFPNVPILAICRLDDPWIAADLLERGEADLVGMTRPHIADPHLLAKLREGRPQEIRSCISCNQGCIGRVELNLPMSCVVNPEVGLEAEWEQLGSVPRNRRRVLVVGGGPTGLEAAVTAARHGHAVTLAEAGDDLGGQMRTAARMRNRERLALLVDEQARDALRLGVEIRTGWRVGADQVVEHGYDAVIVATGSTEVPITVPGHGPARPVSLCAEDPDALGDGVLLLDTDGGWPAAGAAEHLAARGQRVHLVSPVGVAWAVTTYSRLALVKRLGDLGVRSHPGRTLVRIDGDGAAVIADAVSGVEERIEGITAVVHAGPRTARSHLADALVEDGFAGELHVVGDAYAPRTALEAVYEGRMAGAALGSALERLTRDTAPHYVAGGTPFHL